jgi:DNA-binding MarR family transcriptional regulator
VNTRLDRRRLAAWTNFVLSYNQITKVLEREMVEQAGLTLSQYDVLLRLSETADGRMRMSELAEAIVYSTGGLTRLFERMCRSGLTRRENSTEDRRVVYAALTDDGRARLRAASMVHLEGVKRHFARYLDDEELAGVGTFLARLTDTTRTLRCSVDNPR